MCVCMHMGMYMCVCVYKCVQLLYIYKINLNYVIY